MKQNSIITTYERGTLVQMRMNICTLVFTDTEVKKCGILDNVSITDMNNMYNSDFFLIPNWIMNS